MKEQQLNSCMRTTNCFDVLMVLAMCKFQNKRECQTYCYLLQSVLKSCKPFCHYTNNVIFLQKRYIFHHNALNVLIITQHVHTNTPYLMFLFTPYIK